MKDSLATWLNEQIQDRGWTQNELARRVGITSGGMSQIMTRKILPSSDFCVAVAQALGVPPEQVFRLAGLLPQLPNQDDPTLPKLIELINRLSPARRQILYEIAAGFYATDKRKTDGQDD